MDESVFLAAPTGRAAKRMGDLCGIPARTIHRMLEMDPVTGKFSFNAENQLHCDLLIVDEFSMVDTLLAAALLAAIPYRTRIVFVGDADQLPSVGPGNVLNDFIRCPGIPTTRLMHIFRQSGDNDIAEKAAKINQGILPSPIEGPNFHFVPFEEPEQAKAILAGLLATGIRSKISIDQKTELQILTPMRKGPLGVFELNTYLQGLMNPGVTRHNIRGVAWSDGDRVMQIKNNYDIEWQSRSTLGIVGKGIFNGEMGVILQIDRAGRTLEILFDDDRSAVYSFDLLSQLELCYAITVHKSQGSEFDYCVVPLSNIPPRLCTRNILYTAVTRAKKMLILVGDRRYLRAMIDNNSEERRYTCLRERLCESDGNEWPDAEPFPDIFNADVNESGDLK
jgi:exodeoxyribonuclease V alpha subunit